MKNPFKPEPAATPVAPAPKKAEHSANFAFSLQYDSTPLPVARENTSRGWVEYGSDNAYPDFLLELLDTSALHSGIVAGKSFLIAGGDILVGGIPLADWQKTAPVDRQTAVRSFVENSYGEHWSDLKGMAAMDYVVSGSFALEVIWSLDFSRIAEVKHISWACIRPEPKDDEGHVPGYWYAPQWRKSGRMKVEPVRIQAFDVNAHVPEGETVPEDHPYDHRQILYVRNHSASEYFGRPVYTGAINDIRTSAALSEWMLGSAENGFTPSVVITYHEPPQSKEEGNNIASAMMKQFANKGGARKIAVLFANSKDSAPSITPLAVKNVDDSLTAVSDKVQNSIVTGHAVTSPELVGVSVPGLLGSGDIQVKWNIFNVTVIRPSKAVIERTFTMLAEINGVTEDVSFADINPLA